MRKVNQSHNAGLSVILKRNGILVHIILPRYLNPPLNIRAGRYDDIAI